MAEQYKDWSIYCDSKPIPTTDFDWEAVHKNYDASYEGEEDGWADNNLCFYGSSREDLIRQIDNWYEVQEEELNHA